ncbi:hypothetical protein COCNU_04G008220 [Cocos nucifera]|uniref:Uncharacterized protein n=1 Tax=Cocos nucifera TaxID=13894 RepID=A0A8K0I613_COCNU|nr:hypothetical protein COCNU_04G008220 [Cocos nucifera]
MVNISRLNLKESEDEAEEDGANVGTTFSTKEDDANVGTTSKVEEDGANVGIPSVTVPKKLTIKLEPTDAAVGVTPGPASKAIVEVVPRPTFEAKIIPEPTLKAEAEVKVGSSTEEAL